MRIAMFAQRSPASHLEDPDGPNRPDPDPQDGRSGRYRIACSTPPAPAGRSYRPPVDGCQFQILYDHDGVHRVDGVHGVAWLGQKPRAHASKEAHKLYRRRQI